jgi:hypothetical protein
VIASNEVGKESNGKRLSVENEKEMKKAKKRSQQFRILVCVEAAGGRQRFYHLHADCGTFTNPCAY